MDIFIQHFSGKLGHNHHFELVVVEDELSRYSCNDVYLEPETFTLKWLFQLSHEKKNSYFPLYWMVNRDPYNGLL